MGTLRLYFDQPLLAEFDATVTAHAEYQGRPSLVLDRTAFYPESGGQMADRGVLDGVQVSDVQVDDDDVVHHLLEGERPTIGAKVQGEIDLARRRVHMALHTAQHMLSRALLEVVPAAETVSARLGEHQCTIDLAVPELSERQLGAAEDLVHAVIDDDRPIRAFMVTPEELASLALRRAPKVERDVRVVDIGGFDLSPCGGTHCLRTAQVGLVRIAGIERYKGKSRVSFSAGRRARLELAEEARVLTALARELSCGATDVPSHVDKLRRELGGARDLARRAMLRLADSVAEELSDARVVASFDAMGQEFLRALGARLVAMRADTVAFLADRTEAELCVLVVRGDAASFDCGAFVKRAAAEAGGRGGGRPQHAEGRLPITDWPALVARLAVIE
jgi:alanyl-tRNA synthetase